jgi:hypothetical protein
MSTNVVTASTNTFILAIDLGKYKSVTCLHDHTGGPKVSSSVPKMSCGGAVAEFVEKSCVRRRLVLP